ncbi:ChaN family lipoprotein [Pseudomonas cichorii]|uniref:ChaN family lipoprotein n=1 Tax=Pseudomonas cichorii TaxID=36746 RepID=UPI001C89B160|nr:ChaN family lipoprotein [Pseudomonas cichorii]MBX8495941.1 ChaN family lipoprotein [Pseudomonas cichorii]
MIRDNKSGQALSAQQLAERLAVASRVLVGEQHDNPDHHALELWLMQVLAARRPQGSLLLEMLNPDQQARVTAVQSDLAQEKYPSDLPVALNWQKAWDWSLYGPLMRYLLAQPYPVMSANLDTHEIITTYRQAPESSGSLSAAPAVRERLLALIRDSHDVLPEDRLPALLAVQQQRDRRMAQSLLAAPLPSVLFADAWHVRKDVGVPLHLADLGVTEPAVVLLMVRTGEEVEPQSADYVWYTAATPEKDSGAQLRQSLPEA